MNTTLLPSDEKLQEIKTSLELILLSPNLERRERAAAERMRTLLDWELAYGKYDFSADEIRVDKAFSSPMMPLAHSSV